ncbi:hypothetical protein [Kushneria phosphatilytica]|uniref:Uncharacterized protein n=1 Tax=Kushneria phosphatilytica TaxID=657387 RepID=A0A1S1NXS3_9GAMM|nr:hypothetical protein [Kushneria phosphatilytica]OHV09521.1 hypothetical protein BH688_11005 [Kushneria phosphatilytica]QEL11804.1 hypothetical protein FY550_12080 [Kushneria phosphatilytica]
MTTAKHRLDIDGVLCISLQERSDRRALIQQEFAGFDHEIEFVKVRRDEQNPVRGCYLSHQRCAALALERGWQRVLILEDDATFLPPTPRQIQRLNRFLRVRRPEICYLGGMLGRMWRIPWPGVVRARLKGTQAYILSSRGCRRLLGHEWYGKAIDGHYCRHFRAYATYPMISMQQPESAASSDIMAYRLERRAATRCKDEDYWATNYARQASNLRKHWARTLLMRF